MASNLLQVLYSYRTGVPLAAAIFCRCDELKNVSRALQKMLGVQQEGVDRL